MTAIDTVPETAHPMIDRELSWLRFNLRVLEEALDPSNPLIERLRFLTIFHSNLDEFFMIRVSGIKHQIESGVDVVTEQGLTPRQQLAAIREELEPALEQAADLLDELLSGPFAEGDVVLVSYDDLKKKERKHADQLYRDQVHPILTPLAVSPTHPFPFISNLSLNLAVYVRHPKGERRLVRLKIPHRAERFVRVDDLQMPDTVPARLLAIEDLIAHNLGDLFPGMEIEQPYLFRITRDADMEIQEDEADDLLVTLEENLRKRRFGDSVRLEIAANAPEELVKELQEGLHLGDVDTYRIHSWIDPTGFSTLLDLEVPEWKYPPLVPRSYENFESANIFERIAHQDFLVHHPFDSFAPVAAFIHQAARDPKVLAIKQTLYRTSSRSPVIGALLRAAEAGKQVAAMVELKARFDEENNIVWARRLEKAGVHVIYGVPGLKTHAKLSMVVRNEGGSLKRYAHIGTGNYNPDTARVYTDLGLFTADPGITADVADLFNRITGFARPSRFRKLLVAPRFMKKGLLAHIARETELARAGRPARIILKCNALVDRPCIDALYEASAAGVQVDIIVRGICSIVPGLPGVSENIRVRSVIGRFLEHSRVYWFGGDGEPVCLIGSADLMGRNLNRRVEVLTPIDDPELKTWLMTDYLEVYLNDVGRSRQMGSDGTYTRLRDTDPEGVDVHQWFLSHPFRR